MRYPDLTYKQRHHSQRGRARSGGVRGEPPLGYRPVRCPLRVPSQAAGGGGGLEQADERWARDLAGPRPRLSASSEHGLPGQPGRRKLIGFGFSFLRVFTHAVPLCSS